VNTDFLTLATYFGERDRGARGLVADELLDLYGSQRIAASVLLRGSEGFSQRRQMRTESLLSLSEDLPVVSIAVDTRERIESTLELVLAIKHRGLLTLERTALLDGESTAPLPGADAKLTIYAGRRERVSGVPAFVAACELLHRRGVAGASVLLGVDGTRDGRRTRARFFAANTQVPMMIVAVGAGELIAAAADELRELLREPFMTLERVRVCKRDGRLLAKPHELPGSDAGGLPLWQKLTVYTSESTTRDGRPLNLEIIRRLRTSGAAGATSLRGIWGFHGSQPPHGDRFLQVRRQVPVVTVTIDTPQRTARSFEIIDELTDEHGLVTSEMVPAAGALDEPERHRGLRLARHDL
jgi:PII-like signaling protein